jgi:hypothetical protein
MIGLKFQEPDTQEWKAWKDRAEKAKEQMMKDYEAGKEIQIDGELYKKMKEILFRASFGKCVYCETMIDDVDQPGDVEHYRPKGKVTDEADNEVIIKHKGKEKPHPGYFWLAYDWKNLFLACRKCNSPYKDKETGRIYGKGTRFPVADKFWASGPSEIEREHPLFINPFFQNPEEHFEFVPETGELVAKTPEAEACLNLLNLNRPRLADLRKQTYEGVVARVNRADNAAIVSSLQAFMKDLNYLTEYKRGERPYALAGKKAMKDAAERLRPIFDFLYGLDH